MSATEHPNGTTVHGAGEAAVLAVILDALGDHDAKTGSVRVGPGDDAAVLALDGELVITTDAMVEGPDFSLRWSSGYELGWKLAVTNLSDVAAMGAVPIGLTVTVMAPKETNVSLLEQVAQGLRDACATLAPTCEVVGGDLSTSKELAFSVTAVGEMRGLPPVTRDGAQVGDNIAYAGDLGLAALGLRLLRENVSLAGSAKEAELQLAQLWQEHPNPLAAQLAPSPPITLGPVAARAGATSMMDVSDSLSLDAARLCDASGVTFEFESAALGSLTNANADVTLDDMLFGGEDHGLLATFPQNVRLPTGFTKIGTVRERGNSVILDGRVIQPRGWDPYL